jgi:hypothetical protein
MKEHFTKIRKTATGQGLVSFNGGLHNVEEQNKCSGRIKKVQAVEGWFSRNDYWDFKRASRHNRKHRFSLTANG